MLLLKILQGYLLKINMFHYIEGGINLIASLVLVKYFGLAGIFLGTTLSTLLTLFWTQPIIVYRHVFKKHSSDYFYKYGYYLLLTIVTCYLTTSICNMIQFNHNLLDLVVRGILCLMIPNIIYIILFHRTEELQYLFNIIKMNLYTKVKVRKYGYKV